MAESLQQGSRYTEIFEKIEGDAGLREQYTKEAKFLALHSHLRSLGRIQHVEPNLLTGDTTTSLPAYFRLPEFAGNPVNTAALKILPKYSYKPGYADSTDVSINETELSSLFRLPDSMLSAERKGRGAEYVVAFALGFLEPSIAAVYKSADPYDPTFAEDRFNLTLLVDKIHEDLDQSITGEIGEVAQRVRDNEYEDFLDYLIEAKGIISSRVETVFSQAAGTTSD